LCGFYGCDESFSGGMNKAGLLPLGCVVC